MTKGRVKVNQSILVPLKNAAAAHHLMRFYINENAWTRLIPREPDLTTEHSNGSCFRKENELSVPICLLALKKLGKLPK